MHLQYMATDLVNWQQQFQQRSSDKLKYYCQVQFVLALFQQQNLMSNSLEEWLNKLGVSKELNNNDILGGVTINAVLTKIITNYTVRISTTNTASARINNWNIVINQLQKVGVRVSQQQKSKILNGDDKIVYNILYELKSIHDKNRQEVQVDINKIDARGDPKTSKSLLQLFILVIIKYYGFSVKEAVALLSNDSKYLAHILAKGFKENPKPVQLMLLQFQKLLPQITIFCKNKQNETFFLKSIKPGLISKYLSISELSLELISMFVKNCNDKYEIVKSQLMSTLILCLRRHSCQLTSIIRTLTEMVGYNRNLLTLFLNNGSSNEVTLLMIEMVNQCELQNSERQILDQFKLQELIQICLQNMRNSQLLANAATFLIKIVQHHYNYFVSNQDNLVKLVDSLTACNLSKRADVFIYSNVLFAFLQSFGKKKNAIAPQLFKLAVQRYRSTVNEDQSHNYLYNFLQIMEIFPSIPTSGIVQSILARYEGSTTSIAQLEFDIFLNSLESVDQKLALRIYNIITKLFIEEIGSVDSVSNIVQTIVRKFQTKTIYQLTVKFMKVCLAVYYANLRKLNYSKSLIDGGVKLDKNNVFYKAKNKEIQKLITSVVLIRDERLNKTLEPLICYSFIQSQLKNKEESQGIKAIMLLLGDEAQLRKLYQNDAKLMLEDVRNEGRKKNESKQKIQNERYKDIQVKPRVNSDASLLVKKKDYALLLLNPPKVSLDAQKGLQKYTKVFLQKVGKLSLEEERRAQEEERKEQLRRKFTMKILQKGIKINKDMNVNCIYQYNSKEKELQKDSASDFSYLPFYDPQNEEDRDIKALQYTLKKYSKLFKVYYNNYGGKLRPNTIKLFEDISERGNLMQSANVWKLLRDHYLDQYITVNEVQFLVQKINAHLKKQYRDSSLLDFQVFQNFMIQAAVCMFSRPPKDMRSHPISDMLQQIINRMREHAQQNRIDQKMFDQTEAFQSNKPEELKQLNQKLKQNPDYILPEGYKKQTIKKVHFDYKFYLHALDNAYKDVYEVLDQIIGQSLGFHLIQPYSVTVVQATARPILYQTQFDYSIREKSFSSVLPRQMKEKKQGEQQVEQGEEQQNIGQSRVQNKVLKQKRLKQEQKKQKQEEQIKKREERDRQLKALLEKHREKQVEIQKEKQEKKNEQMRKVEEEKKKREKYEEELKKKVAQYMEKKKADKANEEAELRRKKQQELKNMERLKQDVERKKKLVEQSKQKKKQEEEAKRQKELEDLKKKQEESKSKLVEKKQRTKKLLEEYKERKQKERDQQEAQIKQPAAKGDTVSRSKLNSSKQAKQPTKQKVTPSKEVMVEQLDAPENTKN